MKVVAIAGSGRSGSTLVAQLLTQQQGVFNLAQLRNIWAAFAANAVCSCGQHLQDCAVYGQTLNAASVDDMHALSVAFFKDADSRMDWSDDQTRLQLKKTHSGFLSRLKQTLAGLAELTGSNTFVDASKNPSMALAFDLLEEVDLYVLNLVRDPRAVASSWRQKGKSLMGVRRHVGIWRSRQDRLERWGENLRHKFHITQFENFARSPVTELSKIEYWCGLHLPDGVLLEPNRVVLSWDRQHIFPPANERILFERKENLTISPSDNWRSRRNWATHLLARLSTAAYSDRFYDSK